MSEATSDALHDVLISTETDQYPGEAVNVVDGLYALARAVTQGAKHLGLQDASTPMGALEALSGSLRDLEEPINGVGTDISDAVTHAGNRIATALDGLAAAIDRMATTLAGHR
jgi:hypothetical protein